MMPKRISFMAHARYLRGLGGRGFVMHNRHQGAGHAAGVGMLHDVAAIDDAARALLHQFWVRARISASDTRPPPRTSTGTPWAISMTR